MRDRFNKAGEHKYSPGQLHSRNNHDYAGIASDEVQSPQQREGGNNLNGRNHSQQKHTVQCVCVVVAPARNNKRAQAAREHGEYSDTDRNHEAVEQCPADAAGAEYMHVVFKMPLGRKSEAKLLCFRSGFEGAKYHNHHWHKSNQARNSYNDSKHNFS